MRRLTCAAVAAVALLLLPATAGAAPKAIGIGEQSPAIFQDPAWKQLHSRDVRYVVAWDALRVPWQKAEVDAYLAAARDAGARVLLGFSHSRSPRKARRKYLPTPSRMRREFIAFRRHYPWVKTYFTWNEANHRGQPTWNRPDIVARYYDMMRRTCRSCTIAGPSVLDTLAMPVWVRKVERRTTFRVKIWALHNYIDANRFRTRGTLLAAARHAQDEVADLVHGDRRARAPRQRLEDRVRRLEEARGEGDAAGQEARPPEPARQADLLLPLGRARARLHVGLRADRPPRPPAAVVPGREDLHPPQPRGQPAARVAAGGQAEVSRRALALVLAAAALLAAGCGNRDAIRRGGTTGGTTLTVYSSLPTPGGGVSRDIVDGEKLALAQVDGKIGEYSVNFSSLDEAGAGARARQRAAADTARIAMADTQTSALIGTVDSAGARSAIPLLNATGILHVSLGAGYAGFTEPVAADEPARWYPAGRRTFARLVGDDRAQARALVRAAGARRIVVEAEGDDSSQALAAEVRRAARAAGARLATTPGSDGAVIYTGSDPVGAAAVAETEARVVLPDEVVRAGVEELLGGRAARGTVLVSRAPAPGSTPALRAFEAAFERTYERPPGPYAALGHAAMTSVLGALTRAAANDDAGTRQRVIDAFFAAGTQSTAVGPLTVEPDGVLAAPRFSTYRLIGGRRVYAGG